MDDLDQIKKNAGLLSEKKWSGKVKTKVHPPEDLFATGSADAIAKWAKRSHDDLQSAMGSLNFYINRAGKNLSSDRKSVIKSAEEKLRGMFKEGVNEDKSFGSTDEMLRSLMSDLKVEIDWAQDDPDSTKEDLIKELRSTLGRYFKAHVRVHNRMG